MNKISKNFLLAVVMMLAIAGAATVNAEPLKPKNTGILSVKTSPAAYPVRIDGVQVGLSGVGAAAEFYVTPGTHTVEVEGPNGQIFRREYEFKKNVRNCVCLKVLENSIDRPCPYDVRVEAPDRVTEGDVVTFTAINAVAASVPINYRWTVSPDTVKITSGLGSPAITVDTTGLGNQTITAYLDVTDDVYGATCQQKNSVTTTVEPLPKVVTPTPYTCDQFESRSFDDDKARFDNCVIQLQNTPDAQLYIVVYQGTDRLSRTRNNADRLRRRTLDYLVRVRGVDPRRIQFVNGGTRPKTSFTIWIVPPGAQPPMPNE